MPTNRAGAVAVLDLPLPSGGGAGSQSGQIHGGLRAAILSGRLAPGLRLPSSRSLAIQLGVRRNAVVVAYEHLLSDGLVEARVGAGTTVAEQVPKGPAQGRTAPVAPFQVEEAPFALGRTYADPTLLRTLSRAVRRRLTAGDPAHFRYGDPRGGEELRAALAAHLAVNRGVACDPSCILVTAGTQAALRLVAEVLLRPGDVAWMEDPGYPAARRILHAADARVVPVPVDGAGVDIAEGRRRAPDARLAYVTPSHQFPTGVTMTMDRRIALLDWAREAGAWVLEDDYDSEFRYAGPPLTALAGMDGPGRVIYLGTFSKTLFAGLRLGYVVLPPALVERVVAARAVADHFPPTPMEGAVADLLRDGGFAAHVRRTRTRYRVARDLVVDVLTRTSDGLIRVPVPNGGLHLVATLPPDWLPGTAQAIRAAASIEARLLSDTQLTAGGPDGFVLGFSGHSLPDLRRAAERLGRAVRTHAERGIC